MQLTLDLPEDHRLNLVYRIGGALTGAFLLVFGILGFADKLDFFSTDGEQVLGLSSNGLLSLLSLVFGVILLGAAAKGGNLASTVNITVGVIFMGSGLVNLCLLRTTHNFLAFHMSNVIFSCVVGLAVATFGMYGRVTGGLPHDNPYYRARHPEEVAAEEARLAELNAAEAPAAPELARG